MTVSSLAMRAAIFDFDGVIVDSEPLHFRSMQEALLTEGIEITEAEYYSLYLAHDDRGALRLALEHHGRAAGPGFIETLTERKMERFEAVLREVRFFPGAAELVRTLAERVPVAIASGARRAEIEAILTAGGLRDAFCAVVGVDDVTRTKPNPEPYLTAMGRLTRDAPDLVPAQCLAIEDSVPGILSAKTAGMKVVAVTNSYPAGKLTMAHRVVSTLEGLGDDCLDALFEN
ncbi:MAG TPA: HAD family phosphatase [Vicinamibacteria bacterium]